MRGPMLVHSRTKSFLIRYLCTITTMLLASSPLVAYEDQIREEARYIASKIAEQGKTSVAVIDFADLNGNVTHLGRFMAEEMSVALSTAARSFQVVDRTHIKSLLAEHKLSASGLIDQATARELGRIAGVDCLVTATLTPLGDSIRLSIKVLDSNSAGLLASASCAIPKTLAIADLMGYGVTEVGGRARSGRGRPSTTPSGSASNSLEVLTVQEVIITLQECKKTGQSVICHFDFVNQSPDKEIWISRDKTRVFDDLGNEYHSDLVTLGNKSYRYVTKKVVNGILIKGSVTFKGILDEVKKFTLFEFNFNDEILQFRDVPIT